MLGYTDAFWLCHDIPYHGINYLSLSSFSLTPLNLRTTYVDQQMEVVEMHAMAFYYLSLEADLLYLIDLR